MWRVQGRYLAAPETHPSGRQTFTDEGNLAGRGMEGLRKCAQAGVKWETKSKTGKKKRKAGKQWGGGRAGQRQRDSLSGGDIRMSL